MGDHVRLLLYSDTYTLLQRPLFVPSGHNLTLVGEGEYAAIDANQRSRLFEVAEGAGLELINLRLTRGRAQEGEDGGCLLVLGGTVTLIRCRVEFNQAH